MGGIEQQVRSGLPAGSQLTVTCSPGKGPDPTLDISERFADAGYEVLPHVSARTVRSRDHLEEILGRAARFGRLFVIGGDGHDPLGPYASAGELLTAMAEVGHELTDVGIGGYPEGHPLISDPDLLEILVDKQPHATHIATQICFEPESIGRWIETIREAGVRLPVVIGMAGAVKRRKLLEVSLRVGVGPSVRFVSKHGGLVARLMRRGGYRPDAFVAKIAPFYSNPDYAIRGFHVFTFNQIESTERWRREMVEVYRVAGRHIVGPEARPENEEEQEGENEEGTAS